MKAWQYALLLLKQKAGEQTLNAKILIQIITDWQDNVIRLNNLIIKDAEKEFDAGSRVGYGLDGDDEIRDADFTAVRGTLSSNKFIVELKQESERVAARAERIISLLKM
jgi:hypothetical protein